ncbi:hypothetical protein ACHAXR_009606 [Thalassiosira sp. AJA248-18]
MNKRKRTSKEWEGKPRESMEGDLEGGSDGSFDAEIRLAGRDDKPFGGGSNTNPFNDPSSGSDSSSASSGSFSRSSSARGSSSSSSSASAEDISSDNDNKDFWKRKEAEALQQREQKESNNSYTLHTLHEVSDENLSRSGWSLMSAASDDKSDKSVYRAGVEALVREACPEKYHEIDDMMLQYEGREEVLIGHLSTMLAAKNRENASGTDTETSDEGEEENRRSTSTSDYTFSTDTDSSGYRLSTVSGRTLSSNTIGSKTSLGEGAEGTNSSSPSSGGSPQEKQQSPLASPDAVAASSSSENSNAPNDGVNAAILAAGSASAAAAAGLFSTDDDEHSSSSSAGSSDWSSDDGFSSIDTSSLATSESVEGRQPDTNEQALARRSARTLAVIGDASAVSQRVSGYHGSSKPMFIPVDGPADGEGGPGVSTLTDGTAANPTRRDLDDAIQAGDWKAVGATAALIANNVSPSKSGDDDDSHSATSSVTSHEKNQVLELEQLVEAGNWQAVMAAASRYENSSDTESLMESRQSIFDESLVSLAEPTAEPEDPISQKPSPYSSPESNDEKAEIRAEIEELVKTVVPDELENIDEMMIQFRGREDELVTTLRTMQRQSESTSSEEEQRPSTSPEEENEDDYLKAGASATGEDSSVSVFESDREDSTHASASDTDGIEFVGSNSTSSSYISEEEEIILGDAGDADSNM